MGTASSCQNSGSTGTMPLDIKCGGAAWSQELDSMILLGPFLLRIFCDCVNTKQVFLGILNFWMCITPSNSWEYYIKSWNGFDETHENLLHSVHWWESSRLRSISFLFCLWKTLNSTHLLFKSSSLLDLEYIYIYLALHTHIYTLS